MEYTFTENKSNSLLLNGSEQRSLEQHSSKIRVALSNKLSITLDGNLGTKSNTSEFFKTRNYLLKNVETSPAVIFQPNTKYRISINYANKQKKDLLSESRGKVDFNNIVLEGKYSESGKNSLQVKFTFSKINQVGVDANSPVGFEMLESLQQGLNYIWSISYQQNLTSNLQLSLNYDGRKSATSKMIHTGGLQVRAIF